jgi:lipopolysaccharide export LptBFGC system permease protein LptF
MAFPTILVREPVPDSLHWRVTSIIRADSAVYDAGQVGWKLINGRDMPIGDVDIVESNVRTRPIDFYPSSLTPVEIPLKQQEGFKSLLSWRQLAALEKQQRRIKDVAELYLQKSLRITEPIFVMVMLLITLPVLVCRDPKAMKTAILVGFGLSILCSATMFGCKLLATEEFFNRAIPETWAWAPIFLFLPIALLEFDSMRT